MPLHPDSFENSLSNGTPTETKVDGLSSFISEIEMGFFATVNVRPHGKNPLRQCLTIEIVCSQRLLEILYHFNNGDWGNYAQDIGTLELALANLRAKNTKPIDIEELNIVLSDCTIVVNKIYPNSIADQLEFILIHLGYHYVHISKGMKEIPYEIYVPVFENELWDTKDPCTWIEEAKDKGDYYKYWALYYENREEPVIYKLSNHSFISGNLFMLNH